MQAVEEKLTIKVVKRDGKKVDFDASKIAIAIKKGFDSVTDENDELIYDGKDANKVFNGVMNRINKEYKNEEKIIGSCTCCNLCNRYVSLLIIK